MIDFHTHILPNMDDGCDTVEESVSALKLMNDVGVSAVMLTPHFYGDRESVSEFLERRNTSYEKLLKATKNVKVPKLILGAEVSFSRYISDVNDIADLCYEGTKYLLLELPFEKWDSLTYDQIRNLGAKHGITPVIAHFDRYMKFGNKISDMCLFDCPIQVSCYLFGRIIKRRKWFRYIKKNINIVLGSDCHNMVSRPPNIHLAEREIRKKLGDNIADRIDSVGRTMLNIDIEF